LARYLPTHENRPALSPVVAILLPLAISIALTVMLYTTLTPMASSIIGYCAVSQAVERVDSAVLFENSTFIIAVRNVRGWRTS